MDTDERISAVCCSLCFNYRQCAVALTHITEYDVSIISFGYKEDVACFGDE